MSLVPENNEMKDNLKKKKVYWVAVDQFAVVNDKEFRKRFEKVSRFKILLSLPHLCLDCNL